MIDTYEIRDARYQVITSYEGSLQDAHEFAMGYADETGETVYIDEVPVPPVKECELAGAYRVS